MRPLLALLLATAAHAKAQYSGAAMPLTSYSSDTGLGFGARAFARRLGDGEELPVKLEAQAFGTTYGQQFHFASLEVPLDRPLRRGHRPPSRPARRPPPS